MQRHYGSLSPGLKIHRDAGIPQKRLEARLGRGGPASSASVGASASKQSILLLSGVGSDLWTHFGYGPLHNGLETPTLWLTAVNLLLRLMVLLRKDRIISSSLPVPGLFRTVWAPVSFEFLDPFPCLFHTRESGLSENMRLRVNDTCHDEQWFVPQLKTEDCDSKTRPRQPAVRATQQRRR